MPRELDRILVTGANGHLGRQLIESLSEGAGHAGSVRGIRAVVRSERAAATLAHLGDAAEVVLCDYHDEAALTRAAAGCRAVVHLVGIIKEGGGASYEDAHENTCSALVAAAAAAGVERIVYLSIVGSTASSPNTCLASKGRAEDILLAGPVPTTVLRVPMVIGPDDYASASLRKDAQARLVPLIGGGATLQQPIDSRDVVAAIVAALTRPGNDTLSLDLGGPERLTHRALVQRAARLYDGHPTIVPIPERLARGFARLAEKLLGNPPITLAMLEILQNDDRIDEAVTCELLGIDLHPLDETLAAFVGPEGSNA